MSKDYMHDPAKKAWREAKGRFIKKHLKHGMARPQDMSVVCFPGEDALDADFYEGIGVPRDHMVGIECDRRKADAIERKKPGMQVYRGLDKDFLAETDGKFDIIDLDYEGTYNHDFMWTVVNIGSRQLLSQNSMLFTNFLGKRESALNKVLIASGPSMQKLFDTWIKHVDSGTEEGYAVIDFDDTSASERDNAITKTVIQGMKKGKDTRERNPIYERSPNRESILERARKEYDFLSDDVRLIAGDRKLVVEALAAPIFFKELDAHVDAIGLPPIGTLLKMFYSRPYIADDVFRFRYISSNGAPMIGDFFFFTQMRDILGKYEKIADIVYTQDAHDKIMQLMAERVGFGKRPFTPKQLERAITAVTKEIGTELRVVKNAYMGSLSYQNRIFLGSSARREKLTGELYYQCSVVQGMSDGEIADAYKLPEKGSMAAFRAHVRMGTYGQAPSEWFKLHEEDRNGKNQKVEIARRLLAGEDENVLKTEYGLNTLAGIKAALKRGAYDDALAETLAEPEPLQAEEPESDANPRLEAMPGKYAKRMTENKRLRIRYFIDDDLSSIPGDRKVGVIAAVRESRWYKSLNDASDMDVYTFFDDVMLAAKSGRNITKDYVSSLWKRNTNR